MINSAVLVLNKSYQPLGVVSLKRALSLFYVGVAKAVDKNYQQFDFQSWSALSTAAHDETIGTVSRAILVPRVILLSACDRQPSKIVRFSRFNIYTRDKDTCQYCGNKFRRSDLNLDHVIPKSKGGKTSWSNVVCSCYACNLKKGGRTPREAKMKLLKHPSLPSWTPLFNFGKRPHIAWKPFLTMIDASYWHLELIED